MERKKNSNDALLPVLYGFTNQKIRCYSPGKFKNVYILKFKLLKSRRVHFAVLSVMALPKA